MQLAKSDGVKPLFYCIYKSWYYYKKIYNLFL